MPTFSVLSRWFYSARAVRRDARAAKRVVAEIRRCREVEPSRMQQFLRYAPDSLLFSIAAKAAAVTTSVGASTAIIAGSLWAGFPEIPAKMRAATPFLQLSTTLHETFNYWHSVHDAHVVINHFIYHMPDLGFDLALFSPLYLLAAKAFIYFGWRRHLPDYKKALNELVESGRFKPNAPLRLKWKMKPDYIGVIVGEGDPLGDEIVHARGADQALLFATQRQPVSDVWVYLGTDASVADLMAAFETADFNECGGLVLLPVQAQHMVFPPPNAYDISPDKVDDLLRNIKALDKRRMAQGIGRPAPLPIIIVGDKRQATIINTYDPEDGHPLPEQSTKIDLDTLSRNYGPDLVVIDPTDVVLKRLMEIAGGARIDFRGTDESRLLYQDHFLSRLKDLGYRVTQTDHVFRMGYNVTDDPTVADPMNSAAVILTASARDALVEKGFPRDRVLYVPELVFREIKIRMEQLNRPCDVSAEASGSA